jgi:hypothetical protein
MTVGFNHQHVGFSGKINLEDPSLSHLVTKKVKDVIRSAPKGTTLNIREGYLPNTGQIAFCIPPERISPYLKVEGNMDIYSLGNLKTALKEEDLLFVIKTGIKRIKKEGWW